MNPEEAEKKLKAEFGDKIICNRSLADLNTFKTGGAAQFFVEVQTAKELAAVAAAAAKLDIPYFMLGGGSNVLVSDGGFEGLVIKNSIRGIELNGSKISCGAGEELQAVIDFATENGLTGLEFATGIYGTVGGAVFGNAGAYGSEIGSVLLSAELVDRQGNIRTEPAEYFKFEYRNSVLRKTREFVVGAVFALKVGNKDSIREKVDEIRARRNEKLPINARTAGCFFKNIPDKREKYGKLSAGKLLDDIGAKKISYGGARVFEKHANILINDGSANSSELRHLSQILRSRVKDKFGIELIEEITLLGEFKED